MRSFVVGGAQVATFVLDPLDAIAGRTHVPTARPFRSARVFGPLRYCATLATDPVLRVRLRAPS